MSNLELINDVRVELSVELGRKKIAVRELLNLSPGTVLELGVDVGEPLRILANGVLVAFGEAVMVNEKMGVRITGIANEKKS